MTIKIAVCDDEKFAVEQIDSYLSQFQRETDEEFRVFYFSDGESLVRHMPRDVQILFLDIRMKSISGLEAAKKLRDEGCDFYLFFITGNTQYALDGYSVHAYAFLCKPLYYDVFKKHLQEVVMRINRAKPALIEIRDAEGIHLVDSSRIVYAEVFGHTSVLALAGGKSMTSKTPLEQLEKKLLPWGFFRCHKSYLINMKEVNSIRATDVVMSDGSIIPVSRNRKQLFLTAFHEAVDV